MPAPDQDEFAALLNRHKGILYKVANAYCRDEEDRKDLIQEIILQLWRSWGKYDPTYQQSTWVYRIALNVSISFYRQEKRRKAATAPLSDEILAVPNESESGELQEDIRLLYQFINQLPALHRALMILYLDQKTYQEIAEILGITTTNVATKISRIKKTLKHQFAMVQTIDYSKPIAKIQQQLEAVKRHNLRFFQITMLSGPFYMAYIFLGVYLLSGIDFYPRADSAWLTAQLLFSGAMLVGVLWFNYEIGQKPPRYRWARKIVESIGGKEVINGMDFLQELKEFEQE